MITIDFTKTISGPKSIIRKYVKQYNNEHRKIIVVTDVNGKESKRTNLKDLIRPWHEKCMVEIIKMYGAQIIQAQKIREYTTCSSLPGFNTSTSAIATYSGIGQRSIQRYIEKLQQFRLISNIERINTNASTFCIHLNLDTLYLLKNGLPMIVNNIVCKQTITPKNIQKSDLEQPEKSSGQNTKNQEYIKNKTSTCLTNNTRTFNNLITTSEKNVEKTFFGGLNNNLATAQGNKQVATGKYQELAAGSIFKEKISTYVELLMCFIVSQLYRKISFLTDNQLQYAREYLFKEFIEVDKPQKKYDELIFRLIKCSRRLLSDNKYNPLPSIFFNIENMQFSGHFENSKIYWEEFKENKKNKDLYSEKFNDFITKWQSFVKATNTGKNGINWNDYKRGEKYLSVKYPELIPAYQEIILNNFKKIA